MPGFLSTAARLVQRLRVSEVVAVSLSVCAGGSAGLRVCVLAVPTPPLRARVAGCVY